MNRMARAVLVLLLALTVSACSISVNTGSAPTPSPTPSHVTTPPPTPKPVSVVITYQVDSAQCQTNAEVTILIGGHSVGTMGVDSQSNPTDRLTVMMAPVAQKYSLKGTAFFEENGQGFGLSVSGQGDAQVTQGPNSWSLNVDDTRVAASGCPTQGGSWPLVVQT